MKSFDMDLADLAKSFYKDTTRIPLKGNEQRLVRVAFDLFKLRGDNKEELWCIQADDDGNEFLVKTYSEPEDEPVKTAWSISSDKHSNITVAYHNVPISKITTQTLHIENPEDIDIIKKTLQIKLATDLQFVDKYIKSLPSIKQELLKEAGFVSELEEREEEEEENDPLGIGKFLHQMIEKERHMKKELKPILEEQEALDIDISGTRPGRERQLQTELSPTELEALELALKDVPAELTEDPDVPDMLTSVQDKVAFIKWALELGKVHTTEPDRPKWDAPMSEWLDGLDMVENEEDMDKWLGENSSILKNPTYHANLGGDSADNIISGEINTDKE